jgi:transcriptional regulator with XRE-family HTH domain
MGEPGALATSQLSQALRSWCERHGASQSTLAMRLKISATHLNSILRGRTEPGPELNRRIFYLLERDRARSTAARVS